MSVQSCLDSDDVSMVTQPPPPLTKRKVTHPPPPLTKRKEQRKLACSADAVSIDLTEDADVPPPLSSGTAQKQKQLPSHHIVIDLCDDDDDAPQDLVALFNDAMIRVGKLYQADVPAQCQGGSAERNDTRLTSQDIWAEDKGVWKEKPRGRPPFRKRWNPWKGWVATETGPRAKVAGAEAEADSSRGKSSNIHE